MIVLLLVLLVVALGAQPAAAQTDDRGLFGIAPAKVLLETRPPRDVRPLQLTNTTRLTYDVRIFAAPLRQADDGGLTYDTSPEALRLGRRTVRLSTTRYTMGPDTRRDLEVRWLRSFPDQRVAPMGIVVQGIPRGVEGGSLGTDYRLVATYLLQLPGGRRGGGFERLTGEQGARRALDFTALVHNAGEIYDQPKQGRLVIRDRRGRRVAGARFKGDTILPGQRRPFRMTVTKILPAGTYTAVARMRFGGRPRSISHPFRLVGPNELPTTRVEIVDLKASGFAGEPSRSVARIRNTGNVGTRATVRVTLDGSGPVEASRQLAPGAEATVELEHGELREGDHEVAASALVEGRILDSATISLTARPRRSLISRLEEWLSDHAVLVTGLLLALLLLVAVVAIRRRRPRQPGIGVVDLNAASASQLAGLPGVGPKAAQRIVEWRDEYGRLGSVEDLHQVEGFDAARIEALRRHVTAGPR